MNYLAHLYLAGEQPGLVIGGFLGDFVKGPLKGEYPENIELGMRLHRRIDAWSDQHHKLSLARQTLPPELGRYTGIITDLLVDHFLSLHWQSYAQEPLAEFTNRKMTELSSAKNLFPDKALWVFNRMDEGSWLTNYHNLDYCLGALSRIGTRLKRSNPLNRLELPLKQNYQQLEDICTVILGDIKANVAEWRAENTQPTK